MSEIEEVISLRVTEIDDDAHLDKTIESFILDSIESTGMTLSVYFSDPSQVTKNILEPDTLEIVIIKPELIIEEESGEHLREDNASYFLDLQRQFSAKQLEDLLDAAKTAAAVGTSLTILQLILLFFIGKAITSMWILILAIQFIVYIG